MFIQFSMKSSLASNHSIYLNTPTQKILINTFGIEIHYADDYRLV